MKKTKKKKPLGRASLMLNFTYSEEKRQFGPAACLLITSVERGELLQDYDINVESFAWCTPSKLPKKKKV